MGSITILVCHAFIRRALRMLIRGGQDRDAAVMITIRVNLVARI